MTKTATKKVVTKKEDVLDPRQIAFLAAYTDPKSKTFSNAFQSALLAGYTEAYAKNITDVMPDWLLENAGKDRRIKLAEKHIDEVLELPIIVQAMGAFGPLTKKIPTGKFRTVVKKGKKGQKDSKVKEEIFKEEPIMVVSTSIVKEKSKITEFALSSLDRKNYGKDNGTKIGFQFNIVAAKEQYGT